MTPVRKFLQQNPESIDSLKHILVSDRLDVFAAVVFPHANWKTKSQFLLESLAVLHEQEGWEGDSGSFALDKLDQIINHIHSFQEVTCKLCGNNCIGNLKAQVRGEIEVCPDCGKFCGQRCQLVKIQN